jgi:hypothetical protein
LPAAFREDLDFSTGFTRSWRANGRTARARTPEDLNDGTGYFLVRSGCKETKRVETLFYADKIYLFNNNGQHGLYFVW